MWDSYPTKIREKWTHPLGLAPRWLAANGYSDIGDPLLPPDLQDWAASGTYVAPSSGLVPVEWLLTEPVIVGVNDSPYSIPRNAAEKAAYLAELRGYGFRGLRWATQSLDPVTNPWFTIAEVEAHELDTALLWLQNADSEYIKVLINNNYGIETTVSTGIWSTFLSTESGDDLHARTALISIGLRTRYQPVMDWLVDEASRLANYFSYQRITLELANPDVYLWYTDFEDPLNLDSTGQTLCALLAPGSAIVDPRLTLDTIKASMIEAYPTLGNRTWITDSEFIYKEPSVLKIQPYPDISDNIVEVGATEVGGLSDAILAARRQNPRKIYIFCYRPPGYEYYFWTDQASAALSHSNAYAFWPNRLTELQDGMALLPRSSLVGFNEETTSLLQSLVENVVFEESRSSPSLLSVLLSKSLFFDTADPEYAWVVESFDQVDTLQVKLTDSTYANVQEALGPLDLFWGANWKWLQDGTSVLIYGLDLQPQDSENRGTNNWQFISASATYTSGCPIFYEHPFSRHWIPIHPTNIRSDGLLRVNYTDTLRLRTRFSGAGRDLDSFTVRINGEDKIARRVNLWNSLDEKGMWSGLERRDGESNEDYSKYILWSNWFSRNQTKESLQNYLSVYLRTALVNSISVGSTGFSIPSDAEGYSIKDMKQYRYVLENPLNRSTDDNSNFRTRIASGDLGCFYLNTRETSFTQGGSSLIIPDAFIDNYVDYGFINWRVRYWSEQASAVVFTTNFFNQGDDLTVLFPRKVRVVDPDEAALKRSFNRTSPVYRWRSIVDEEAINELNKIAGLAVFD